MKTDIQVKYLKIFIVVILVLLAACAKQGYPPGGPVDKTPPLVIRTQPAPDSTGIATDARVMLEFSETVDHNTCEESIFITPYSGDDVKYKWQGRRLWITFPRPLAENRTYVITVGTGTKDLRNNSMKFSYSLAFSTGDHLDIAEVRGRVYGDAEVKGAQIWAYDLADKAEPDPTNDFPLYITQASETGDYRLAYMAYGQYRLFAVMDRDMNTLYDPQFDLLGVGMRDVVLNDSLSVVESFPFRIALRDTTPPVLYSANAPDQRHVDLRFSEAMQPKGMEDMSNFVFYTVFDTLGIMDVYPDADKPYLVHVTTEPQLPDTTYRVRVLTGYDLAGFSLGADTLDVKFRGSAVPDTTGPVYVSMQPADSSRNVMLDTTITVMFSEIMDRESVEKHLVLADTLGDTLSGAFVWKNGANVTFYPDSDLKPETFYLLTLPVDSTVFDAFGNPLADTLFTKRFTSVNPDTLSEIAGKLTDADTTASGPLQITAAMLNGPEKSIWLQGEGAYRFTRLLPGSYVLSVYRDENGDGKYSGGEAFPFIPAERFYIYPDTVHIRSRWPDEGEDITLPGY